MVGARQCEVCKDAPSKYKCPSCLAPYCSLPCYKKHKEIPCSSQVPSHEKPCLPLVPKRSLQVDESRLLVHKEKLESLVLSNEVLDALKDEKLQKLICSIDCATNSDNELEKAMELEDFCKFSEKILSVIGM